MSLSRKKNNLPYFKWKKVIINYNGTGEDDFSKGEVIKVKIEEQVLQEDKTCQLFFLKRRTFSEGSCYWW